MPFSASLLVASRSRVHAAVPVLIWFHMEATGMAKVLQGHALSLVERLLSGHRSEWVRFGKGTARDGTAEYSIKLADGRELSGTDPVELLSRAFARSGWESAREGEGA